MEKFIGGIKDHKDLLVKAGLFVGGAAIGAFANEKMQTPNYVVIEPIVNEPEEETEEEEVK